MAELGRVGNSWNFNFRDVPTFLQVCEKRCQATRKFYGKVQVGKDQEKAQSEKDSHSKNRGGKKPN